MAGGGSVTFACDGIITLTSTITNKANTTVDASGHNITISGGNSVGVFYVATNTTLTLITVAVADGSGAAGAGAFNDGGTLILQQTHFRSNSATNAVGMERYYPFMCSGGRRQRWQRRQRFWWSGRNVQSHQLHVGVECR